MKKDIRLRKFPYPYRCMFAVCNDNDLMTTERFVELHAFLNSQDEETVHGKGLGLDIGDSFWIYNNNPFEKDQMAYLKNLKTYEFKDKDLIHEYYKKGILDTLHTYGDFNYSPSFNREIAGRAIKELEENDIKIKVWVNHGGPHNFQNLERGLGDMPFYADGSGKRYPIPEYHADILTDYGTKFFWLDELTHIIGQDRRCSILEYYLSIKDISIVKRLVYLAIAFLAVPLKDNGFIRRKLGLLLGEEFIMGLDNNSLLKMRKLRDGQEVYTFIRYGDHVYATSDDMDKILNDDVLNTLIKKEGYMVFYTHLGKVKNRERGISLIGDIFKQLKSYYERKDILVCKTSDLLWYNLVSSRLNWHVDHNKIIIDGVEDKLAGPFIPTIKDLRGITFYAQDPSDIELYIKEKSGLKKVENLQVNDEDHRGLKSISISW